MGVERVERGGLVYAIIVHPADMKVDRNTFFTSGDMPLQVGVITHEKGYIEKPHYHKRKERRVVQTWQTLHMLKGTVEVSFYDKKAVRFKSVKIKRGDIILLMDGVHSISALTSFVCESVKQGPYTSVVEDKVSLVEGV